MGWNGRIRSPMHIIEIDIVCVQVFQTLLQTRTQKFLSIVGRERVGHDIVFDTKLGCKEDIVAFACALEPFANEGFRVAVYDRTTTRKINKA
jgi:hypothetical protein